jgi:hypothetical protein
MKSIHSFLKTNLWYHSAPIALREAIGQNGLLVNQTANFTTQGSSWANNIYGVGPIYISKVPGESNFTRFMTNGEDYDIWTVTVDGLGLVADLPSMIDAGAYLEEEGMSWGGTLEYFEDLLTPGSIETNEAIEATGTAAVLQNIEPQRLVLNNQA